MVYDDHASEKCGFRSAKSSLEETENGDVLVGPRLLRTMAGTRIAAGAPAVGDGAGIVIKGL